MHRLRAFTFALRLFAVLLLCDAAVVVAQKKPTPAPSPKTTAAVTKTVSTPGPKPSTAAPQAINNPLDASTLDQDFGSLPTNITSDTLVLHSNDRVFVYKGHVVVVQGDMTLTSKTLEGTYNEQNQIEKLVAKGDVLITKQEIKATCQQALYDAPSSTVTLIDNPQLQQKDSVLNADKIKIFLNDNRSQAEGNVRVTLIKPEGGNLGIGPAKPTAAATAVITPKFVTSNAPTPREVTITPKSTVRPTAGVTPVAAAVKELD